MCVCVCVFVYVYVFCVCVCVCVCGNAGQSFRIRAIHFYLQKTEINNVISFLKTVKL